MSICKFSIKEFVMTLLNNFPWSTLSSNINSIWPIQYYHMGFKINLMKLVIGQLRASTSVDAKLRKIQKVTNFTHFAQKIFHIDLSKTVYTCVTLIVYICTVTVAMYPIILLISHFTHFFSLSSPCTTNSVLDFSYPHLIFLQIHTNTPTPTYKAHKHIHTEKSTQRYTNIPTHKYTHTDKPIERQIGAGVGCLWIGASGVKSEFMGQWKWVWMLVDWCWRQRLVLVG